MGRKVWVFVASLALASSTMGQVSGNSVAPVADTIGEGAVTFDFSAASCAAKASSRYSHWDMILFGPTNWLELGIGSDFCTDAAFGFKVMAWRSKDDRFAIGGGASGLAAGNKPLAFVSGRASLADIDCHFGLERFEGETTAFLGVTRILTQHLSLAADHYFGPAGLSSATLSYDLGKGFGVYGGFIWPNSRSEERTHHLGFTYSFTGK
ncbi:MAG: hypothetical protein MUC92_13815 [Fimbriimonadaceae bacterium]|jgi:hypothetical protein|nr:hypothetical protein [Fimbriimonadaceae bacterium]